MRVGFLGFFRQRRSGLILPSLQLCAIFRGENPSASQVLLGVNVLRFLLLTFLLSALLTSRCGDILSGARGHTNHDARENQETR